MLQQIVLEENNINQLALSIFLGYAPNHLGMAKFHEIWNKIILHKVGSKILSGGPPLRRNIC